MGRPLTCTYCRGPIHGTPAPGPGPAAHRHPLDCEAAELRAEVATLIARATLAETERDCAEAARVLAVERAEECEHERDEALAQLCEATDRMLAAEKALAATTAENAHLRTRLASSERVTTALARAIPLSHAYACAIERDDRPCDCGVRVVVDALTAHMSASDVMVEP